MVEEWRWVGGSSPSHSQAPAAFAWSLLPLLMLIIYICWCALPRHNAVSAVKYSVPRALDGPDERQGALNPHHPVQILTTYWLCDQWLQLYLVPPFQKW